MVPARTEIHRVRVCVIARATWRPRHFAAHLPYMRACDRPGVTGPPMAPLIQAATRHHQLQLAPNSKAGFLIPLTRSAGRKMQIVLCGVTVTHPTPALTPPETSSWLCVIALGY